MKRVSPTQIWLVTFFLMFFSPYASFAKSSRRFIGNAFQTTLVSKFTNFQFPTTRTIVSLSKSDFFYVNPFPLFVN